MPHDGDRIGSPAARSLAWRGTPGIAYSSERIDQCKRGRPESGGFLSDDQNLIYPQVALDFAAKVAAG